MSQRVRSPMTASARAPSATATAPTVRHSMLNMAMDQVPHSANARCARGLPPSPGFGGRVGGEVGRALSKRHGRLRKPQENVMRLFARLLIAALFVVPVVAQTQPPAGGATADAARRRCSATAWRRPGCEPWSAPVRPGDHVGARSPSAACWPCTRSRTATSSRSTTRCSAATFCW